MSRQQFTFTISYSDVGWLSLGDNKVADPEGPDAGHEKGKSLDECKRTCDENPKCHSFAFGGANGDCWQKDNCIESSVKTKPGNGFTTYYKVCGKIVNIFNYNALKFISDFVMKIPTNYLLLFVF